MSTLGDIGHVDEEGYVYLTDRASFMIISGGVNIYPQECENLLVTHPKVADAAVFGVPNEEMGEEVKAVVAAHAGRRAGRGDGGRTDRLLPRASRPPEMPALDRFRGGAAAPADRQALQGPVARALLEGAREPHRLTCPATTRIDVGNIDALSICDLLDLFDRLSLSGPLDRIKGTGAAPILDIDGLPVFTVTCDSGPLKGATYTVTDLGRAMISGQCADVGKFKGPILRGLAARAPYFHNGSARTLADVVTFYDQRFNIGFTEQEQKDLAAFLESLLTLSRGGQGSPEPGAVSRAHGVISASAWRMDVLGTPNRPP